MQSNIENSLGFSTKMMLGLVSVLVVLVFTVLGLVINEKPSNISNSTDSLLVKNYQAPDSNFTHLWEAPADWRLAQLDKNQCDLIHYGKDLIANTAEYLGPNGTVSHISNGMNCQNCHLNAGTKAWGNNYFAVASTYPKIRARSGKLESKEKRINDCFERSLNGKALDSTSKEMRAMVAYMDWIGSDVEKKHTPKGTGIFKLKLLKRAADPTKGEEVYTQKCQSCHQTNGQGILAEGGKKFTYPPLWGKNSYNDGAGLYRLSNLAGYVKYNMPLGVTYQNTQLSDEEAWDVAAYINSQTRPHKDLSQDWPKIADKPFDHPFGPYTDPFSELQHKYGPFKAIKDWKKKRN
ncbi:c-type cytochrome [Flectobacillus rivi]|uniref:C-type cytochrome n=1 Tax=Flectobacillus rivi TaxID=2984209 RepID=A0ABT6YYT2_9BACT|nr:c-type cytochrome [Flectobacillus rivi]MDI9874037.1 c-type cytochrome [Flectobacillus rivi]